MARQITLALVQVKAPKDVEEGIERLSGSVADAARKGADLVLLPDLSLLPFFPQNLTDPGAFELAEAIPQGRSFVALQALARKNRVALAATIYERVQDGVYYDTGIIINSDGELLETQRMMHIPEEPGFHEKFYYKPGNSPYPVVEVAGAKVGLAVGQDHFYPETHRLLALHGAELILVPNAIAALSDPLLLSSQAAAVMNHVYVAVANRTGVSGRHEFVGRSHIAGPSGEVLVQASEEEGVIAHKLDLELLGRIRRSQNYWLRDRRPETYGDLTRNIV